MSKPSWDKYFMGMAEQAASRSIDPHYKVGAVIVSADNRILSTGYNGFPSGWNEKNLDWNNKEELRPYIVHAEMNALIYSRCCLKKAKIYSTLCPCVSCVLLLGAAGIKKIYYRQEYKHDKKVYQFCKKIGITIKKIK